MKKSKAFIFAFLFAFLLAGCGVNPAVFSFPTDSSSSASKDSSGSHPDLPYSDPTKVNYVATFMNDDGTVLDSRQWMKGAIPSFYGPTPKKASGVDYDYTFSGWLPQPSPLESDATYRAQYASSSRRYLISFTNSDGSVLSSQEWAYGSLPSYEKTPTQPADAASSFTFNGWDHEITAVKGPDTYKATYTTAPKEYTVTFANDDGQILESKQWTYGNTPIYSGSTPRKATVAGYAYGFAGWSPAVVKVTKDATYTALFSESVLQKIVFSSSENKLNTSAPLSTGYSGQGIAVSSKGIHFSFAYAGLCNPTDRWQTLNGGGFFMNTSPIRGMQMLSLKKADSASSFQIYWSVTTNFTEADSQTYDANSDLTMACSFNGASPAFVKVVAVGTKTSSIAEGYFAFDEGNGYVSLSLTPIPAVGGTTSGSGVYLSGEKVTIVATPALGYNFAGWYQAGTLVSSSGSYLISLAKEDVTYEARFSICAYACLHLLTQEYGTNPAGTCAVKGEGYYLLGTNATVSAEPQDGYGFLGWYEGVTLLSTNNPYTFPVRNADATLTAKYSKKYPVSVSSKDETKGTVSGAGDFAFGSTVTVRGTPARISSISSISWYRDSSEAVSNSFTYSFVMPEAAVALTADFSGTLGYNFELGKFPQTVVEDSATLTALASATDEDSDGYLEYGSNEYKIVVGTPYGSGYYKSASGNVTFVSGAVYYFKVEPIRWKTLSGRGSATGLVISSQVLGSVAYCTSESDRIIADVTIHPNNYQYSTLRAMLNGYDGTSYSVENFTGKGFIDVAFNETEKTYIATTTVDNSAATTDSATNPQACANTDDKIFALSYDDFVSGEYGFSSSPSVNGESRRGIPTDYARATGAWISTNPGTSYFGNTFCWSRSPCAEDTNCASCLYINGEFVRRVAFGDCYGFRPSFMANLD